MDEENQCEKIEHSQGEISENKSVQSLTEKFRENPWMLSTVILGVLVLIFLVGSFGGTGFAITGGAIGVDNVGSNFIQFAENQVEGIKVLGVTEENGFYNIEYSSSKGDGIVQVTLDGKFLVTGLIPMNEEVPTASTDSNPAESVEVPKSDKPEVELFVMTHCPYGTQAEKGFIPFMESVGNLVDAKIRYVHYFMHDPEETETPRQVCIREEQPTKYLSYLREFLVEGNSDSALIKAKIDVDAMNECISNGNAEKYYDEDSKLSESYGVRGSPTLVVNGAIANSGRDAASYLSAACSAFNNIPSECSSLELSSQAPSPMWGWDASGSATTAQC
jgi:protein-disulfide isomerase